MGCACGGGMAAAVRLGALVRVRAERGPRLDARAACICACASRSTSSPGGTWRVGAFDVAASHPAGLTSRRGNDAAEASSSILSRHEQLEEQPSKR